MGWPQILWIVLAALGVGIAIANHGKPKTGRENAWSTIIATALAWALLSAGGFFP
jgi:LPXTG-motif cell wall-anchored protein